MVSTKKNSIKLDLENYRIALEKSLYDEEWVENLYQDKTNVINFFEKVGSKKAITNAIRFIETKKIKYLLQTKDQTVLPEFACQRFFEAGKPEQTLSIISEIYNQTEYFANRIEDLLNEYSENTRNFMEATIAPFPNEITETWRPITRFKVNDSIVQINPSGLEFENNNNHTINQYFVERQNKKLLEKLYIKSGAISENDFKFARRKLLNHKDTPIPTNIAYINNENCDYKITCKSNQLVSRNNIEYTITGNNISVYHIAEVKK